MTNQNKEAVAKDSFKSSAQNFDTSQQFFTPTVVLTTSEEKGPCKNACPGCKKFNLL